ncbi:MAG: YciI family protein [Deltaproteobacteria bacterium]|nr:YciI family protein [Deltaproteobacteria bacterium]
MQFLCLAYEDEGTLNRLTANEWEALKQETQAYVQQLERSGHLVVTRALESVNTARTVRVRQQRLLATDGPFAETRETLGGFFLIEARDIDEAVRIAAAWPSARFGSIEVRPTLAALRSGSRYGPPA